MPTCFASRLRRVLPRTVAGLLLAGLAWAVPAVAQAKAAFDYYLSGSAADVVLPRPSTPMTVLMGGGPDVDAAFVAMIRKAGGGDFVVLRASGADGYNAYLLAMGGLDSVETLVVRTREAAADAYVIDRVARAEAIFIAGGDQADYVEQWKGTPLHAALQAAVAAQVPVGGTSAGLAVLGQFDFAALNGTVTSDEALKDPYQRRMTLDRGFLVGAGLGGVIADAHLDTRDRMGRLLAFVARLVQDGWVGTEAARAIGVDVETALVVDDGVGTRLGVGAVYFVRPSIAPTVCQPKQPLTFRNVLVDRLSGDGGFVLDRWSARAGATTRYDLSAEAGVLLSSQPGGAIY